MNLHELTVRFEEWLTATRELNEDPRFTVLSDMATYVHAALPIVADALSERADDDLRDQGGTLCSLVGSSPQTTLLLSALLQPREIVLIESGDRTGADFARNLADLLRATGFPADAIRCVSVDARMPLKVYRAVKKALEECQHPVFLDITGGKKTMSAGAFAAGAECGGYTRTIYLDGQYRSVLGVPTPGTESVEVMVNEDIGAILELQRQIQEAWKKHQYEEALSRLEDLARRKGPHQNTPEMEQAVDNTRSLSDWVSARYDMVEPRFLPAWVRPLASQWEALGATQTAEGKPRDRDEVLSERPGLLFRYVADELVWIRSRDGMPARTRYLRAFALGDYLVESTWHLWTSDPTRWATDPAATDGWWDAGRIALVMGSKSGAKKLKTELHGWDRLDKACIQPWFGGDPARHRRNKCAHQVGRVDEAHVTQLLDALPVLATELLNRLHTLPDRPDDLPTADEWMSWIREPRIPPADLPRLLDDALFR